MNKILPNTQTRCEIYKMYRNGKRDNVKILGRIPPI